MDNRLSVFGWIRLTGKREREREREREIERERDVLFNDALNTFYLRLYGVRHIVKDHSDSEKENPLPPHKSKVKFVLFNDATGTH